MKYTLFEETAKVLRVFAADSKEIPVKMPTNFITVNKDFFLKNPELLKSLIQCYKQNFGRSDVWGEGYKCLKCGRVLSLEYVQKYTKCNFCNGNKLKEIHSDKDLTERILHEADDKAFPRPFLLVHDPKNNKRLVGFMWGIVASLSQIQKEIVSMRYLDEQDIGNAVMHALEHALFTHGIDFQSKIFYVAEAGIDPEFRGAHHGGYMFYLSRGVLEYVYANGGAECILYWTNNLSSVLEWGRHSSFELIMEASGKPVLYYLLNKRPRDMLAIYQNLSLPELVDLYKMSSKEFKKQVHCIIRREVRIDI